MLKRIQPEDPQVKVMRNKLQRINYNAREATVAINKVLRFAQLGNMSKKDLELAKKHILKISDET